MPNKLSNHLYNQLPHVVQNHPDTNPEHWAIMICLYRILKDKKQCIYSSDQLSLDTRIPLRTIGRRLPELVAMGFINIVGRSYNRRFSLGLLFTTSAKCDDKELNTSAKNDETSAKSAYLTGHSGRDTKNSTKSSTKGSDFFSFPQNPKTPSVTDHQEYAAGIKGYEWVGEWISENK